MAPAFQSPLRLKQCYSNGSNSFSYNSDTRDEQYLHELHCQMHDCMKLLTLFGLMEQ